MQLATLKLNDIKAGNPSAYVICSDSIFTRPVLTTSTVVYENDNSTAKKQIGSVNGRVECLCVLVLWPFPPLSPFFVPKTGFEVEPERETTRRPFLRLPPFLLLF